MDEVKALLMEIELTEKRLKELKEQKSRIGRELQPKARYEYTVIWQKEDPRFEPLSLFTDTFRIVGKLLNEDELREHLNTYGSSSGIDPVRRSVGYYLYKGKLGHFGGGYLWLVEDMECTDEDWAEFRAGRIPLGFLKDSF